MLENDWFAFYESENKVYIGLILMTLFGLFLWKVVDVLTYQRTIYSKNGVSKIVIYSSKWSLNPFGKVTQFCPGYAYFYNKKGILIKVDYIYQVGDRFQEIKWDKNGDPWLIHQTPTHEN